MGQFGETEEDCILFEERHHPLCCTLTTYPQCESRLIGHRGEKKKFRP